MPQRRVLHVTGVDEKTDDDEKRCNQHIVCLVPDEKSTQYDGYTDAVKNTKREVANSAIEAGAIVSVQNEGRVFCYAEGKLIFTLFN